MATTLYAMAMKHNLKTPPAADWDSRLEAIPGVTIEGRTVRSAQFTATPEAIAKVRAEFSAQFHIEEVRDRSPS